MRAAQIAWLLDVALLPLLSPVVTAALALTVRDRIETDAQAAISKTCLSFFICLKISHGGSEARGCETPGDLNAAKPQTARATRHSRDQRGSARIGRPARSIGNKTLPSSIAR